MGAPSSLNVFMDEFPGHNIGVTPAAFIINLEFIRCAFHAAEHAVADTPYQNIWDKYVPALVKTMGDFFDCVDQEGEQEYGQISYNSSKFTIIPQLLRNINVCFSVFGI